MDPPVNFCIPGAGRSGTTSLYALLGQHPDIGLCTRKEPNYFTTNYEKKRHWYHKLFEGPPKKRVGEASTRYMYDPRAPERMSQYNPELKFIFILRNPVDRAYSNYKREVSKLGQSKSFEDAAWGQSSHYLYASLYGAHIETYLKYFDRDQLAFVRFREFIECPFDVLSRLCRFLGIDPDHGFDSLDTRKNESKPPWSPSVQRVVNQLFRNRKGDGPLLWASKGIIRRSISWLNHVGDPQPFPPLADDTRTRLEAFFEKDILNLNSTVPFDATAWIT